MTRATARRACVALLSAALSGAALLSAALCSGAEASAEPDAASAASSERWLSQRLSLGGEVRHFAGIERRSGIRLRSYGVGGWLRLTPALAWRTSAFGLRLAGATEGGAPASFGIGGDTALTLTPWPDALVSPYALAGVGLLMFPSDPFLPGGDHYAFMLRSGVGMRVMATSQLSLDLGLFATHLSNGQGIGPHNPALDGYGAALGLSYALSRRTRLASDWQHASDSLPGQQRQTDAWHLPAVMLEGAAGTADAFIGVARARITQRLVGPLLVVLDGEAGSLADAPFGEAGVALVTHLPAVSFGAHGGYRRYVGLDTWVLSGQLEGHLSDEVSAFVMAHHEDNALFGSVWRSAVGVRAYPHRTLLLELGAGLDRIGSEDPGRETDVIAIIGVDWALPLPLGDWQIAAFGESQLANVRLLGLRLGYGAGTTPRAFARERGWRRVR